MTGAIDLGGTWQLREAIGETWRWYLSAPPPQALNNVGAGFDTPLQGYSTTEGGFDTPLQGYSTAEVPGSVVDGLARAGVIEDPRRGWGSRSAEWTGSRSWVLRRTVVLDEEWVGAAAVLELEGTDPGARVFWDGSEVARLDGIYDSARVPVTVDRAGEHHLVVVLDPVPAGVPQVGRTEGVTRHAPRLGYGWDFCPPFPHQGIWRPIRLRRGPHIAALEVASRYDPATGRGEVEIRATVAGASPVSIEVDAGDGRPPIVVEAVPDDGVALARVEVPDAPLWHPVGHGSPRLAGVRVRVGDHVEQRRVGFRAIEWHRTPGSPEGAERYGLRVNGRPVPLAGINWAPADAQYGSVTPERIAHLLDLAVAAGVRLVRVWGGGLVETEEFFDACDERGLLVWQEFSQSSSGLQSAPSDDPDFVARLAADARALVPARRHHPSLVLWGGGNELQEGDAPLRTDQSPALRALADVVHELDPQRGWLPTSPSGPSFHHRLADIRRAPADQHDVHGPWEYQGLEEQHTLAAAGTALAHTEFGVEGMANARLWNHVVPEGRGEPADRSNPLHRHLGEWWDNAPQVQQLFGGGLDLDELRRASQWLQTSGLAIALEADRRRWPRTSMVLPWQLAESYPNTWGTALVGFDGEPKPALGAVARAFAPERVTLVTERTAWAGHPEAAAEAWLWSETGRAAGGRLELSALDLTGRVLASASADLGTIGDPAAAARITLPTPAGPFLWRARWTDAAGTEVDDELVLQTGDADLAALRTLPRTVLEVSAEASGWLVRNTGSTAAVGWGARDVRPGDDTRLLAVLGDPRPLLPGATARLSVVSGTPRPGDLIVDAWNADPRPLP